MSTGGSVTAMGSAPALLAGTSEINKASKLIARSQYNLWVFIMMYSSYLSEEL
jgi:hypothetical protein